MMFYLTQTSDVIGTCTSATQTGQVLHSIYWNHNRERLCAAAGVLSECNLQYSAELFLGSSLRASRMDCAALNVRL